MNHSHEKTQQNKKPYQAPTVEETTSFETLALACAQFDQYCDPPYDTGSQNS